MKKITLSALAVSLLYSMTIAYAVTNPPSNLSSFQEAHWLSKNSSDPFTIQSGTDIEIVIQINVEGTSPTAAGVDVKNCGNTTHINAGSSTICTTSDPKSPVTLTSDSGNVSASGTYQIKQK